MRGKGRVLFTGGGGAQYPWDQAASPSIGKAGLRSLALTSGQELACASWFGLDHGRGCRRVAIGPGENRLRLPWHRSATLGMAQRPDDGYETEMMFIGQ